LVRGGWGDAVDRATEAGLPGGAALYLPSEGRAWVLVEDQPTRGLGPALTWAARHASPDDELHVLVAAEAAPTLARRAALFSRDVVVWAVDGTSLRPAEAAPLPAEPPLDPGADAFVALFEEVGAEAVVEGGMLRAEVLGLEVARVEEGPRLAVGVGKHDREAHREVKGGEPGFDELFEVVRIVAQHRVAGGEGHAAYHLSPERWLRAVVVRQPSLVGAASLHPVPSPVVRDDLRAPAPAPAAGVDHDGDSLLVVCSVGLDLDLVPAAADAWLADGRKPRLVVCVPGGDDHRVTHDLVGALAVPAEVVTVDREWRT
jgi:hypothetical protein